jgi:AcrR family transcriptional regulator
MAIPVPNSTPRTQRERVEESSRRLLDAAVALIGEQGFDKTTVAEIGRRAGYSHSMVHARYGSKNALLEAVFRELWVPRLAPRSNDREKSGLDRLLGQIDVAIDAFREEPELYRAITVLAFEMPLHGDTLKPWYNEWFAQYLARTVENLAAGERDGTIRPGLDHHAEAEQFAIYGSGLSFRWSIDWDGYDMDRGLQTWRELTRVRLAAPDPKAR